ncbi:MAG: pre-peptidase C-terminal domain-containing protein [Planctomycetes bacterium]|nr:pre-peptidase C-terminal domain-containing protein [Planctomycetota bacterium]
MRPTLLASLALFLVPFPALADDPFEENDSSRTAALVGSGTYENLVADDADWFAVDAPAGGSIEVSIEFPGASGDLDLVLVSPALAALARSEGTGDRESVRTTAAAAGRYLFEVYGYQGARNVYRMVVSARSRADDSFEENDTFAAARAIQPGNQFLELLDDDWFSARVVAGDTLSADVLFDHAKGDLDLSLHDATGTRLASSESTTNQERVSWAARSAGSLFLRVYGYQGAKGSYELRLRVSAPAPAAADPGARGSRAVGEVRGTIFDSARQKNIQVILHYPALSDGIGTAIDASSGPASLVAHGHGRYGAGPQNPPNMLGWNYYYEHLASNGFFIIAPDLDVNSVSPESSEQPRRQIVTNGEDLRYCLTFLLNANGTAGSSFAGKIDPGKVGVTGHSRGGEAALYVGRADARVRAVVAIAPTDFHGITFAGKPLLLFNATHDCDVVPRIQQAIFDRWVGDVRLLTVIGGDHFYWTDSTGPICPVPIQRSVQHAITKHYVLAFLDLRLRGNTRFQDAYLTQLPSSGIQQK